MDSYKKVENYIFQKIKVWTKIFAHSKTVCKLPYEIDPNLRI